MSCVCLKGSITEDDSFFKGMTRRLTSGNIPWKRSGDKGEVSHAYKTKQFSLIRTRSCLIFDACLREVSIL